MVITKDILDMLERAEAMRVEVGFDGTLADMLTDGACLFAASFLAERVRRANEVAGRVLGQ